MRNGRTQSVNCWKASWGVTVAYRATKNRGVLLTFVGRGLKEKQSEQCFEIGVDRSKLKVVRKFAAGIP